MEFSEIFGSWDEKIDSPFTNHEPMISTLISRTKHDIWIQIWVKITHSWLVEN